MKPYTYNIVFSTLDDLLSVFIEGDHYLDANFDAIDRIYKCCKNCNTSKLMVILTLEGDASRAELLKSIKYGLELFSDPKYKIAILDYNDKSILNLVINEMDKEYSNAKVKMFRSVKEALKYLFENGD